MLTFVGMAIGALLLFARPASAATTGDDYPAKWRNVPQDSVFDSWGEWNRECTSAAAWWLHERNHFEMPFHDNAAGWGPDAKARHFTVNKTPGIGAIAWWGAKNHVAWVEAIHGSKVKIEEYNYDFHGHYNAREIAAGSPDEYIHFKDIKRPATGSDGVGYYEPGPAGWHLRNSPSAGSSDYIFSRGKAGVIPVVGNWDGKGGDGVGYYDPTDYSWHLRNSPSAGASDYAFVRGKPGVIPVVGNWDGKGGDGVGYYEPGPAGWHLRNSPSAGSSNYIFSRGKAGVIPVVGNWDGK